MKLHSIKENHLFRRVYKSGRRLGSGTVVVYVLRDRAAKALARRNPEKKEINRLGISASKKVGGAVQRNRAKRVIREAYRLIDKEIGVKTGCLIIIVPLKKCTVCSMGEVKADLVRVLGELDLLSAPR